MECNNQKDCQSLPQSKELPGSVTISRTARECYNQKDCQGVPQSKGARECLYQKDYTECHDQKCCQRVLQLEGLSGNDTIRRTARMCHKPQSEWLSGSATIESTGRKYYNQKDCKGVQQSNGLPERNKYTKVSQFKEMPGSLTIRRTDCQGVS